MAEPMNWQDVEGEPTADLIDYIKCRDHADYAELAESSFIAFTFRFRREIIDRCRRIGQRWKYDEATCDELAETVFERFLKYPFGFKVGQCGTLNIDTCVKLYLFTIAARVFIDHYHKTSAADVSPYDGSECVVAEFPDLDEMDLSEDQLENLRRMQEKIEEALSKLTPKHRIIYLTYKTYEHEGYKLPRVLLQKLREYLDLEQSSIRVYKKEAFEAVEKRLEN